MNLTKTTIIMASLLASAGAAVSASDNSAEIISRPAFEVKDGKFTPELIEAFGQVGSPQLSPDKQKILYTVTFTSIAENKGNTELWVMDVDGKNNRQLTTTSESEANAVWLNGGRQIAFLYKAENGLQLFVMDADGSNRKQISSVEKGLGGFIFSPDEKKVLFICNVKYGKTVTDEYPDLNKANAFIIDDLMYKHWDEWVTEIPHPFIADYDGEKLTNITDIMEGEPYESPMKPFGGIESMAWTPDSKGVVYVSRKKTGKEYSLSTNSDLYLYDIPAKRTKNLTEGMLGYDTNPVFSPKGDKLAWLSMERDGYESDKNRIFVMDMQTGEKTDLTKDWDYTVNTISWAPDGKNIYFIAPYHGPSPIFQINLDTKKIEAIADQMCDYASVTPIDSKKVIALRHSLLYPNEMFIVGKGYEQQLTNVNTELLSQLSPVTVEKHLIPTTDGKEMLTWVLLPPNFDKTKKYPAILYCQGGPQQAVSQFWSSRWNLRLMASQGYVVIAPNRRGLPGFGTEWNEQISARFWNRVERANFR